jgi:hypothetical protein
MKKRFPGAVGRIWPTVAKNPLPRLTCHNLHRQSFLLANLGDAPPTQLFDNFFTTLESSGQLQSDSTPTQVLQYM